MSDSPDRFSICNVLLALFLIAVLSAGIYFAWLFFSASDYFWLLGILCISSIAAAVWFLFFCPIPLLIEEFRKLFR